MEMIGDFEIHPLEGENKRWGVFKRLHDDKTKDNHKGRFLIGADSKEEAINHIREFYDPNWTPSEE